MAAIEPAAPAPMTTTRRGELRGAMHTVKTHARLAEALELRARWQRVTRRVLGDQYLGEADALPRLDHAVQHPRRIGRVDKGNVIAPFAECAGKGKRRLGAGGYSYLIVPDKRRPKK